MEPVGAKFYGVRSPVPNNIVVEFKIVVVTRCEQSRVSHCGERTAEGNIGVSHIQRARCDTLEPAQSNKINPRIRASLSTVDVHPSKSEFIQQV